MNSDTEVRFPRRALLREDVSSSGYRSMPAVALARENSDTPALDRNLHSIPFEDITMMDSEHHPTPESTQGLTGTALREYISVPSDVILTRGIHALSRWLCSFMCIAQSCLEFPACHYFFSTFCYVPENNMTPSLDSVAMLDSILDVGRPTRQFRTKMEEMIKTWDLIKMISLFFIGAAPVILQIQPVYTNNVTRVSVVASGLLGCASLVCSYIYVVNKDRFLTRRSMDVKWKAASTSITEFWSLVALPLTFVLWSFVFFLVTLFYFIWGLAFTIADNDDDAESKEVHYMDMLVSALFVTAIPIVSFVKIYHARKKIKDNDSI